MPPDLAVLPFARFEELARNLVHLDAELGEQPRHRLVGYCGEDPLAVIDLRPFPAGGIEAPMVEAMAGVLALGADRFATALPGRAWSMEDPVVPVTADADLRQRVLMLTTARPDEPVATWLLPFDLTNGDELTWHPAVLDNGPCEGWVPQALEIAVAADWRPDLDAAVEQLARCTSLGHHVMLSPAGAALLDRSPGTSPRRPD